MKNVMTGRLGGLMKEKEKSCHAELVSASSVRESRCRWTLKRVQGDGNKRGKIAVCGFTLIELLVVVLIIGILAAVALPQYQRVRVKADLMRVYVLLRDIYKAEQMYYLANNDYTQDLRNLDIEVNKGPWVGSYPGQRFDVYRGDIHAYSWGIVYRNLKDPGARYDIRIYFDGRPSTCAPVGAEKSSPLIEYACDVWFKTWENK